MASRAARSLRTHGKGGTDIRLKGFRNLGMKGVALAPDEDQRRKERALRFQRGNPLPAPERKFCAWAGGEVTHNKEEALRAFAERKGLPVEALEVAVPHRASARAKASPAEAAGSRRRERVDKTAGPAGNHLDVFLRKGVGTATVALPPPPAPSGGGRSAGKAGRKRAASNEAVGASSEAAADGYGALLEAGSGSRAIVEPPAQHDASGDPVKLLRALRKRLRHIEALEASCADQQLDAAQRAKLDRKRDTVQAIAELEAIGTSASPAGKR